MSRVVSDCSRCCGLCCIVPAYLQEQGFPEDKRADKPCRHLEHGRCAIHAQRTNLGFGACAGFDCHGAGQWITQQLFGGASWLDSPHTARAMGGAWRYWLPRFEAAALLEAAMPLVRAEQREVLAARIAQLFDASRYPGAALTDRTALRRHTLELIRSLL
jgi:hypothetical protein